MSADPSSASAPTQAPHPVSSTAEPADLSKPPAQKKEKKDKKAANAPSAPLEVALDYVPGHIHLYLFMRFCFMADDPATRFL